MKMNNNKDSEYFYCYSMKLFKYLKMDKKINYICSALHEKTVNKFWLFNRDDELNKALTEYMERVVEVTK